MPQHLFTSLILLFNNPNILKARPRSGKIIQCVLNCVLKYNSTSGIQKNKNKKTNNKKKHLHLLGMSEVTATLPAEFWAITIVLIMNLFQIHHQPDQYEVASEN